MDSDFSSGGAIRVGDSTTTCDGTSEGAIRFDADGGNSLDYCDGANWLSLLTSSVSGGVVNNGNSFAAPMVIGTNDNNTLAFETNGTTHMIIDTSGNVGVGTAGPDDSFHVYKIGAMRSSFETQGNLASLSIPSLTLKRARDSAGSRTAVNSGDLLGALTFSGYRTTGYAVAGSASIVARAEEGFTDTTIGTSLLFGTTPIGGNTKVERMIIDSTGRIGIGTDSPAVELDMHTGSINAAQICDENNANCLDLSSGVGGGGYSAGDTFLAGDGSTASPSISFQNATNSGFYRDGTSIGITVAGVNQGSMTNNSWEIYRKIRTSNCSAAEPCFSFATDNDTGMFDSGTNKLGFSTSGTEQVTIDATGNVGIGTTTPTSKIFIYDAAGDREMIELRGNAHSTNLMLGTVNGDTAVVGGGGGDSLILYSNDDVNSGILIDPDGDVAIGSTTASRQVDIEDGPSTGDTAPLRVLNSHNGTNNTALELVKSRADSTSAPQGAGPVIVFRSEGSSDGNYPVVGRLGAHWDRAQSSGSDRYSYMSFTVMNNNSPVERMRLDTDGNLGLGTSAPAAKIEAVGEIRSIDGSGNNRLWGQGRPGTTRYGTTGVELGLCTNGGVSFGLSYSAVSWSGSASACPQGTWVCTAAERGTATCNTARPDHASNDAADCTGSFVNYAANDHNGWVADIGGYVNSGYSVTEQGATNNGWLPCNSQPIWCCSE